MMSSMAGFGGSPGQPTWHACSHGMSRRSGLAWLRVSLFAGVGLFQVSHTLGLRGDAGRFSWSPFTSAPHQFKALHPQVASEAPTASPRTPGATTLAVTRALRASWISTGRWVLLDHPLLGGPGPWTVAWGFTIIIGVDVHVAISKIIAKMLLMMRMRRRRRIRMRMMRIRRMMMMMMKPTVWT